LAQEKVVTRHVARVGSARRNTHDTCYTCTQLRMHAAQAQVRRSLISSKQQCKRYVISVSFIVLARALS